MLNVILAIIVYHLAVGFVVFHYDRIKGIPRYIFKVMFTIATHEEMKFFILSMARLAINTGAGVASVSVVGYFIPPLEVAAATLVVVGVFGIIMSLSGYYIERALNK